MADVPKVYPANVRFLIADDAREEQGNKYTIIGYLSGDDVLLPGGKPGGLLPTLVILNTLKDGAGTFQMSALLKAPGGTTLAKVQPTALSKEPNRPHTTLFRFVPFPVKEFGIYQFVLSLDNHPYEFSFRISNEMMDW